MRNLILALSVVIALTVVGAIITCRPAEQQPVLTVAATALDCLPTAITQLIACHQAADVSCAVTAVAAFVVCVAAHPHPPVHAVPTAPAGTVPLDGPVPPAVGAQYPGTGGDGGPHGSS